MIAQPEGPKATHGHATESHPVSDRVEFWQLRPCAGKPRYCQTVEKAAENLDRAAEKAADMIRLEHARGGGVPHAYQTAWLFMQIALAHHQDFGATDTVVTEVAFGVVFDLIREVYRYPSERAVRIELSRHYELRHYVGFVFSP
jgi:hypothetical protein